MMKALIFHKNNLLDIKIEQFCQSTAEVLKRIREKYVNIEMERILKKSKKRNKQEG